MRLDHCTTLRRRSLAQMLWSSRSAGVSVTRRPPCRGQCSGIRSGCGCERRARQAQAPFTARRGGCLDVRCLEKVLRRARSPHRRGATRSGGRRGRARVGELGNLETWDPAARSRTPQVARIPDFQFLAPAATSAGATGGAGEGRGAGGCAGRHACPPESPRGAHSGGGHGLHPWGGAARPSRREGSEFGGRARGCSRRRHSRSASARERGRRSPLLSSFVTHRLQR